MKRFHAIRATIVACLLCLPLCACSTSCPAEPTDTVETSETSDIHETEETEQIDQTEVPTMPDTETETLTETAPETTAETEAETVAATEPETETETEVETRPPYSGSDSKTVNLAADLANSVTGYYPSAKKNTFVIENQNATLTYNLSDPSRPYGIASLATPDGKVYLSDTADSFIKLANGQTFYASDTIGRVNLYDQGFYYYDVHVLDQTFGSDDDIIREQKVDPQNYTGQHDLRKVAKNAEGGITLTVESATDPYICFGGLSFDTSLYTTAIITLRSSFSTSAELFFVAGSEANFTGQQRMSFPVLADGEYHSYMVRLSHGHDYTGTLSALRLDIGSQADETIDVASIQLVGLDPALPQVTLDRDFISYSDKINDVVRFMADETVTGVASIGTEWRIPADTVEKLIVGGKNGDHTTIGEVDWNTAVYVGLDIRDTGIFGLILLPHETSGSLSVELIDGEYIIRQTYTPTGGTLAKGSSTYVGHRIYTDATHSFDDFLYTAACERKPLQGIKVLDDKKNAYYVGYNALRGAYEFSLRNSGNFSYLYEHPDETYSVTFELAGGDRDRQIYILAATTNGCLEGSAVLDRNDRLLPVQVEVCKNFAGDGEELYYTNNDSQSYGYAIFPMTVAAGETERLTVLHLYERWGTYRLKQVSSIRFTQAYYHMSTGVTETNCISFFDYWGNRLPDHRALSQPYWRDTYLSALDQNGNPIGNKTMVGNQPQHENNGTHTFLRYKNAYGTQISTLSQRHHIDSSGPTYFDLTMSYITDDGCIEADIRHMEMAQYDENRAYYELDYRVTGEVTIDDFKDSFEIYALTSNRTQQYQQLGYLDADNQSRIVKASARRRAVYYTLGSEYPYFDYFCLEDTDTTQFDRNDVYSNVSVLIKDWDIVIGGQPYTGALILREQDHRLVLTLDLEDVTLLPGDYIHIDLILMPWGDCHSTDDSNVRLTRENTLLHPITVTSEQDTPTDDPFLPGVRSADGQSATFTVSGGLDNIDRTGYASAGNTAYSTHYDRDYNVAVRVYGLHDLGTLKLYELIDGQWILVDLSSALGYDGYSVLYDEDNSFSYAFNINMNAAAPRTFKVTVMVE